MVIPKNLNDRDLRDWLLERVEELEFELAEAQREQAAEIDAGFAAEIDAGFAAEVGWRSGLTPMETGLFLALWQARGRVLTKDAINQRLPALSKERDDIQIKIIDVYVCKIRAKLGSEVIETIWGRGYRMSASMVAKLNQVRAKYDEVVNGGRALPPPPQQLLLESAVH